MRLERVLQVQIAALVILGTVMLGIAQQDASLPIAGCVVVPLALYLTDFTGRLRLRGWLANVVALIVVLTSLNELLRFDSQRQLLGIARLLSYLQIVLMLQPKNDRVYWHLLLLSFLQIAVGAIQSSGFLFGSLMVLYLFVALLAMAAFFMLRETRPFLQEVPGARRKTAVGGAVKGRTRVRVDRPSTAPRPWFVRLIGDGTESEVTPRLWKQVVSIGLWTLLVASVFFFVAPRRGGSTMLLTANEGVVGRAIGYNQQVELGEVGQIQSNQQPVMEVQFVEADSGRVYELSHEPYFRGAVLGTYERNRWRPSYRPSGAPYRPRERPRPMDTPSSLHGIVRQKIVIEPMNDTVLFAVHPLVGARSSRSVRFDSYRQRLVRTEEAARARFSFSVGTTGLVGGVQDPITPILQPLDEYELQALLEMSPDQREGFASVRAVAAQVLKNVSSREESVAQRARTLEQYMLSGRFEYTLDEPRRDPALNPIEDFLVNQPRGNCEYFASALVLMLRSQNIAARMVIGYRGGAWNDIGEFYQVTQGHAHTWVEAFVPLEELPARYASRAEFAGGGWMRLDPTPAAGEANGAQETLQTESFFPQLIAYTKRIWLTYVVGLDADRQQELLWEPLRSILAGLVDSERWKGRLATLSNLSSRTAVWLIAAIAFLMAVGVASRGLIPRLFRALRGMQPLRRSGDSAHRPTAVQIEFYRRYETLLKRHGLTRDPFQTPQEFARQTASRLDSIGRSALGALSERIVRMFYRVRFGQHSLTASERQTIEGDLKHLEQWLCEDLNPRPEAT